MDMEMDQDDDVQHDDSFNDFIVTIRIPVEYIRMANRRFGVEYLTRVYGIFMLQLLLSGAYVLYPTEWWTAIQLSLIISPFVVNVWDYVGLRQFYPFTLAGLLLAEFALLEYIAFSQDIDTILLGLIITFGLCSLLYTFTYFTEKVIVLGLPPTNLILVLLTITVVSSVKNEIIFDVCSSLKHLLALFYVLFRSYVIQPLIVSEYIHAGTRLHVNFLFILASVFTILNL